MPKVTVGMVGAGGIARAHIEAWKTLAQEFDLELLVYSVEGASQLVEEASFGDEVESLPELWSRAQVVDIVTPTFTHFELVKEALELGLDVICEKPLALTSQEARQVTNLANERDRKLYPAHVVRYFPQYVEAKRAVQQGLIGDLAIMRLQRVGSFPDWSAWFADQSLSGGVVLDLMVHDLDICRWIAGEVTEVYATLAHDLDEAGNNESFAQAVLTHESGALSYVNAVWGAPGTKFNTAFQLSGSEGEVHYSSLENSTITFDLGNSASEAESQINLPSLDTFESPYLTELRDFFSSTELGSEPSVTAGDGVAAVSLAEAVAMSASLGAPVNPRTLTVVER